MALCIPVGNQTVCFRGTSNKTIEQVYAARESGQQAVESAGIAGVNGQFHGGSEVLPITIADAPEVTLDDPIYGDYIISPTGSTVGGPLDYTVYFGNQVKAEFVRLTFVPSPEALGHDFTFVYYDQYGAAYTTDAPIQVINADMFETYDMTVAVTAPSPDSYINSLNITSATAGNAEFLIRNRFWFETIPFTQGYWSAGRFGITVDESEKMISMQPFGTVLPNNYLLINPEYRMAKPDAIRFMVSDYFLIEGMTFTLNFVGQGGFGDIIGGVEFTVPSGGDGLPFEIDITGMKANLQNNRLVALQLYGPTGETLYITDSVSNPPIAIVASDGIITDPLGTDAAGAPTTVSLGSPTVMSANVEYTGNIASASEYHVYSFNGVAGMDYHIGNDPMFDADLYLYGPTGGNPIGYDNGDLDGWGAPGNVPTGWEFSVYSTIKYSVNTTGTYYVVIKGNGTWTGNYGLIMEEVAGGGGGLPKG